MAGTPDLATQFLKTTYGKKDVNDLARTGGTMYQMIKEETGDFGKEKRVLAIHDELVANNITFSDAQTDAETADIQGKEFVLTPYFEHFIARVSTVTMLQSMGDGGWLDAFKERVDSVMRYAVKRLSTVVWGDGYGVIGQCGTIPGSGVLVLPLKDKSTIHRFAIGQKVQFLDNTAGYIAALRDSGQALTIDAIDLDAGTIRFTQAPADEITAIAADDFIIIKGTYAGGTGAAATAKKLPTGAFGWIGSSAPAAAESFFGVDRSVHTLLGGFRVDATLLDLESALTRGGENISSVGGAQELLAFVSVARWNALSIDLEGRKRDVEITGRTGVGHTAIEIMVSGKKFKVLSDRFLQDSDAFVTEMSRNRMYSWGKGSPFVDEGSVVISNASGLEARIMYLCQFYFSPSRSCHIHSLAAIS